MPNHRSQSASWAVPSRHVKRLRAHMDATRRDLKQRYWLRVHVFAIATLCLLALWLFSHSLMLLGVDSLALRYVIALPLAYGWYLLLLWLWAQMLVRRESPWDGADLPVPDGGGPPSAEGPSFGSGGGGDFGGGGADASFDAPDVLPEGAGNVVEGAGSLLDGADEGALVLVPLAVVVGAVLLIAGLLGAGVFMVFGVEVLLGVAVEVALAAVAGSWAYRGFAEGWLFTALRHTWRGAIAALVLAAVLGAVIDRWLPEARSFPHAVRLIAGR